MPPYLTPGVYVEEVPPRARPIAGVSTSTAAFIGYSDNMDPREMPVRSAATIFKTGTVTFEKASHKLTLTGGTWPAFPDAATTARYGTVILLEGRLADVASRTSDTVIVLESNDGAPAADIVAGKPFELRLAGHPKQAAEKTIHLITDWSEFRELFGDFHPKNQYLAHAVYGFFNNGGSRCHVARVRTTGDVTSTLESVAPIDEVSIVAAPMPPRIGTAAVTQTQLTAVHRALLAHCESLEDRVAVLDPLADPEATVDRPGTSTGYGAIYYPWIKVTDPLKPTGESITVPPSGHIAGVYARTDTRRGVHKAPANEDLIGVVGFAKDITNAIQDELNPNGINCLRGFYGTPLVWGARTVATDAQYVYLNVRRYLCYLRESIIQGTRWVVFEPNSYGLWQRITRSVEGFLLGEWRQGALFGADPKEAFRVDCNKSTNPPDVRERGLVVTEIKVAITKPAEFVVFRIQQETGS